MQSSPPISAVVDTNVPLVANGKHEVSAGCVHSCAHALREVMRKGRVYIDSNWLIINEYRKRLSQSGQPGPGDAFFKWLLTNKDNPMRCVQVKVTPTDHRNSDFIEFPRDAELKNFDPSDRKFIAVSIVHNDHPVILQATDSKWWTLREPLSRNKVNVRFLCPEDIKEMHNKKEKEDND